MRLEKLAALFGLIGCLAPLARTCYADESCGAPRISPRPAWPTGISGADRWPTAPRP